MLNNNRLPFEFGIDPDSGEYGYIKRGADSVIPFKYQDIDGEYTVHFDNTGYEDILDPVPDRKLVNYIVSESRGGGTEFVDKFTRERLASPTFEIPFNENTNAGGYTLFGWKDQLDNIYESGTNYTIPLYQYDTTLTPQWNDIICREANPDSAGAVSIPINLRKGQWYVCVLAEHTVANDGSQNLYRDTAWSITQSTGVSYSTTANPDPSRIESSMSIYMVDVSEDAGTITFTSPYSASYWANIMFAVAFPAKEGAVIPYISFKNASGQTATHSLLIESGKWRVWTDGACQHYTSGHGNGVNHGVQVATTTAGGETVSYSRADAFRMNFSDPFELSGISPFEHRVTVTVSNYTNHHIFANMVVVAPYYQ